MYDVTIRLENRPGAMAEMGETLGAAGVSVEGGGCWLVDGVATAHFLFEDGEAARTALGAKDIEVLYSDHDNQLILAVDDIEKGRVVSEEWKRRPLG